MNSRMKRIVLIEPRFKEIPDILVDEAGNLHYGIERVEVDLLFPIPRTGRTERRILRNHMPEGFTGFFAPVSRAVRLGQYERIPVFYYRMEKHDVESPMPVKY